MAEYKQAEGVNYEEDLDNVELNNYKGMFFNEDPGQKFQDEKTGAHFDFNEMCKRLFQLKKMSPEEYITAKSSIIQYVESIKDSVNESFGKESQRQKANENNGAFRALQVIQMNARENGSRNVPKELSQKDFGTILKKNIELGYKSHFYSQFDNREPTSTYDAEAPQHPPKTKCNYSQRINNGPIKENIVKPEPITVKKPSFVEEHRKTPRKQVFIEL